MAAIGVLLVAGLAGATSATASTLFVSAAGRSGGTCSEGAPCRSIMRAVDRALPGDTVIVEHGSYGEQVTLAKDVSLVGEGKPVINASGRANGVLITGNRAQGASIRGFTVRHATFEGILASSTAGVTIADNLVTSNDLGRSAAAPVGECAPVAGGPGDCGEGIHLMSVTDSAVVSNVVEHNAGGILLSDELGPSALNLISGNRALDNPVGDGITLVSVNPRALVAGGVPQPAMAGVYGNYVVKNLAEADGGGGQGAGILLAARGPGMAVYDNVINSNTANRDGLAGITLHSLAAGEDLNGNVFTGNDLSEDALHGGAGGGPGDAAFGVGNTVGILIASSSGPLSATVIAANAIDRVHYAIWTRGVPPMQQTENPYAFAPVPLLQG